MAKLVFVLFQKLFGIDRGHAAGARGRDRLPIAMVLHIAGYEHARNGGKAAVLGEQVAVRIHFEFPLEDNGVRIVADGDEYAVERNLASFPGLLIAQAHAFDRSEERRVGKECRLTCRSRWSPY